VIWHKGITPDVIVALAQGVSPEFLDDELAMSAGQLHDSRDTQLLRALELLCQPTQTRQDPAPARWQRAVGSEHGV